MHLSSDQENTKRRAINLTIREDLVQEARTLKLNTSRAAEAGILAAIKQAREEAWLEQNKAALQAHNARIEKSGTLLTPGWASEE